MQDCIFCKIANREIPADIVYENEKVLVFKDIKPLAPCPPSLVCLKKHISTLVRTCVSEGGFRDIMGQVQLLALSVARELEPLGEQGFRLVCVRGWEAGQEAMHIHYHLQGRPLWRHRAKSPALNFKT